MDKKMLAIYSQFLQVAFNQATATNLSALTDNEISHDKCTRFLSARDYTGKDLWQLVKPTVRRLSAQTTDLKLLIIDDHIQEKAHSKVNGLIAWHFDHSKRRCLKGINQVSALYYVSDYSIPVSFDFVIKDQIIKDKKTGKQKRKSSETKNDKFRRIVSQSVSNQLAIDFVLADSWYNGKANMLHLNDLNLKFVLPLNDNHGVALSLEDKKAGRYERVDSLPLEEGSVYDVYVKGVAFPLRLCQQVFTNKDSSQGIIYLVSNELSLSYEAMTTIYQKRWKVEEHHRSIKTNFNYGKSPAHSIRTQINHCFAVLYATFDWECLSKRLGHNHYALKRKIYINALKNAWREVSDMRLQVATPIGEALAA
ncbi:MAG: transposase [Bernardetiaceae bacterium]|nr:transposase [Bernardetiaceae bacterium]